MEVSELIRILGGVAPRKVLIRVAGRLATERAITSGEVVRLARGRYGLPDIDAGLALAQRSSGHVCLASAALSYGWAVKTVPELPQIALPKDRRLSTKLRSGLAAHWIDLHWSETEGFATSRDKTLEMCGRRLPFDEALAIADSALRAGYPPGALHETAARAKGPGSARLRSVAAHADGRAANPFESVLRAICLSVPGLQVAPQVAVRGSRGFTATPDLVDVDLGMIIEADSFGWHGDRKALRKDARRYDHLTAEGWVVLRFAWEDVMHDQDWVRAILIDTVAVAQRTKRLRKSSSAA